MKVKRANAVFTALLVAMVFSSIGSYSPSATAQLPVASVFISDEVFAPTTAGSCSGQTANSSTGIAVRSAVAAQDDAWRTSATANGADSFISLTLPTPSSPNEVDFHPTPVVVPGANLTVNVSKNDVTAADRTSTAPNSWGTLDVASYRDPYTPAWGTSPSASTLQDCAPRPTHLYDGVLLPQPRMWNATAGSGSTFDAAFFEFSRPVDTFGAWFGDLETRTDGEGQPGVVKLFGSAGQVLYVGDIPTSTTDQANECGGSGQASNQHGCGNRATRWIGFDQPGIQVAAMLVVVGDDDSCNDALPSVGNGDCDGFGEHLSWVGATIALKDPELTIEKSADAGPYTIGDTVDFAIDVRNVGAFPATIVAVSDTLPDGLHPISAAGSGWTCSTVASDVSCSLDAPLDGESSAAPIIVTASVAAEMNESVTNTAIVRHTFDGDVVETSDQASITRLLSADLSVAIVAEVSGAGNNEIVWTITVSNLGPDSASSVAIIDKLPSGLTFLGANGTGWSCNESGSTVSCDLGTQLAVGQESTITITTLADDAGAVFVNSVEGSSSTPDPDTSNNSGNQSVAVPPPPSTTVPSTTVPSTTVPSSTQLTATLATSAAPTPTTAVPSAEVDPATLAFTGSATSELLVVFGILISLGFVLIMLRGVRFSSRVHHEEGISARTGL